MGAIEETVTNPSSFINGCRLCGSVTAHPEDRNIQLCEVHAEPWEPLPNIKRVKKAVKEAKA